MTGRRYTGQCVGFTSVASILICVLAVMILTRHAAGQIGWIELARDPIPEEQFNRYLDRLGASNEQRSAAGQLYAQYKVRVEAFANSDIATLREKQQSLFRGGVPTRQSIQEFIAERRAVQKAFSDIDDSLFDQLKPLVGERRAALLPRLRLHWQRTQCLRYADLSITMFLEFQKQLGLAPIDLSEILLALELPADVAAAIDPVVVKYERRLTTEVEKLIEISDDTVLKQCDAWAENGLTGVSRLRINDPQIRQKWKEIDRQIGLGFYQSLITVGTRFRELNRETYEGVLPVLPPESARRFRDMYYGRTYPELAWLETLEEPGSFKRLLDLDSNDLATDTREAAATIVSECRTEVDRLIREAIRLIEARPAPAWPLDEIMAAGQECYERIADLEFDAERAYTAASESLRKLLR